MTLLHGVLSSLPLPDASGSRYFLVGKLAGPGIAPRDVRLVLERQPHHQAFLYFWDDLKGLKRFIMRVTPDSFDSAPVAYQKKLKLANGKPSEFTLAFLSNDLRLGLKHFGFEV